MNAMEMGMILYQEIETVKRSSKGDWTWSKVLDNVSQVDAMTICQIAGCWCDEPSGRVKFYTNQNHMFHRS